ncbi:MAG: hypothetical protein DFNUSKGM_000443, partial [Candidatus Fervidibacter sacchari]
MVSFWWQLLSACLMCFAFGAQMQKWEVADVANPDLPGRKVEVRYDDR